LLARSEASSSAYACHIRSKAYDEWLGGAEMYSYNEIVVAVDVDENTDLIVGAASELNEHYFRAEVSIVHVCEPHVTGYGELMGKNHLANEMQIRQSLFPQLRLVAKKYGIPGNRIHILFGKVAESLFYFTEERNSNLIIIGPHDKHGLSDIFADYELAMTRNSRCDVLSVKSAALV
jgi:nucleotide-binding universal stress UspA family protein